MTRLAEVLVIILTTRLISFNIVRGFCYALRMTRVCGAHFKESRQNCGGTVVVLPGIPSIHWRWFGCERLYANQKIRSEDPQCSYHGGRIPPKQCIWVPMLALMEGMKEHDIADGDQGRTQVFAALICSAQMTSEASVPSESFARLAKA